MATRTCSKCGIIFDPPPEGQLSRPLGNHEKRCQGARPKAGQPGLALVQAYAQGHAKAKAQGKAKMAAKAKAPPPAKAKPKAKISAKRAAGVLGSSKAKAKAKAKGNPR